MTSKVDPVLVPVLKVHCGLKLKTLKKVLKLAIGVLEFLEIVFHCLPEALLSDKVHQLLHCAGSLAVGNSIKNSRSLLAMLHLTRNGVSSSLVILLVPPKRLLHEQNPGLRALEAQLVLDGIKGLVAHKFSEGLIKPEVVPPLHCD